MATQTGTNRTGDSAPSRPGTPSLLRELNDRAALELLIDGRSLTRAQLSELTGVSKVTVAQMLARLEERGLVAAVGSQNGGRGPNATLYSVVPSSAYVAALYVEHGLVSTAVADVTGRVIAEAREDTNGEGDPVELVRSAVDRACHRAGVSVSMLSAFVIGSPGIVDPATGDPKLSYNLPAWHEGVLAGLRGALHKNVLIENDVNLAAMAEHAIGAAAGADDFVLLWIGVGVGLATVLGGRLHRGVSGAAGEIGWLPMPGAPVTSDVRYPAGGGLQWLAGSEAVRAIAAEHGFGDAEPGAPEPGIVEPGSACPGAAGDAVRAAVAAAPAERASSSRNWPAAWRSAPPPCARSSTPAWSCSAARSAWPAGRRSPTGWPPRSRGSARCAPAWSPPPWPPSRCCAAPCSRPSTRPARTSWPRWRANPPATRPSCAVTH